MAQLVEYRTTMREVAGLNPSQTNTQGFEITKENRPLSIILKFSLAVRLKGHIQRKLNEHVYSFLLLVSSKPHYQAEF